MNNSSRLIAKGPLFFTGPDAGNGALKASVSGWETQRGDYETYQPMLPMDLRAVDVMTFRLSATESLWYSPEENRFWSIAYEQQRGGWGIVRLLSRDLDGARSELSDIRWSDIRMWEQEELLGAV